MQGNQLSMLVDRDQPIGCPEVVIIKNPDIRYFKQRSLEVRHRARVSRFQLLRRHIMAPLSHSHSHTLF
jgi:hypothetical protein